MVSFNLGVKVVYTNDVQYADFIIDTENIRTYRTDFQYQYFIGSFNIY